MIDGQPVLVDGLHRLEEALRLKMATIDVLLIDGDMVDVLTRNLKLDHLRGKHPASEMLAVIEALSKEYGLDSEKIADKTGLTRDYVEKLQAIAQLTPLIRAALDDERIKVSHAYELTRLRDPVQQETVFHQQQMYHWTVKELATYITDLSNVQPPPPPGPTEPPAPILVKCAYCGDEYDPRSGKIANPNTCQTCAGILFAARAQARVEAEAEVRQRGAAGGQGDRG
jgi:ParB-like chromosome segregation protein Spo0J